MEAHKIWSAAMWDTRTLYYISTKDVNCDCQRPEHLEGSGGKLIQKTLKI